MNQQSDLDLIRQINRQNLEDMARQQKGGWRYWIPPAGVALLLFSCGAFCGIALTLVLTR
ncbi:hypothetical protein NMD10_27680 (plasmid) [Citrobacter portucalensis]|uniref:hypothetical protein n=1 Tax=Citrobacter portucalensis TaxID=1639133 RepID=UPI00351CE6CC